MLPLFPSYLEVRNMEEHFRIFFLLKNPFCKPLFWQDLYDAQWRNFHGKLTILTLVMGIFTSVANTLRWQYRLKGEWMSVIWILISLTYLLYLHGAWYAFCFQESCTSIISSNLMVYLLVLFIKLQCCVCPFNCFDQLFPSEGVCFCSMLLHFYSLYMIHHIDSCWTGMQCFILKV